MTCVVWFQYLLFGLGALFQLMAMYKAWRYFETPRSNRGRARVGFSQRVVNSVRVRKAKPNPDVVVLDTYAQEKTEFVEEKPEFVEEKQDECIRPGDLAKTERIPFIQTFRLRAKNTEQTLVNG